MDLRQIRQGRKVEKMSLTVRPISLAEANSFITNLHRHHSKVQGHKFSISCYDGERLCGVACVGRPVSRRLDNGRTLEVTRLCTDGTYNACSILYARCARIARDMGYTKIITYILGEESGVSLRASGWHFEQEAGGGSWSCPTRPRELVEVNLFGEKQKYPINKKQRWAKEL